MPMNNKFIVPVALGLSLVTVTAFVVYYVFKKDEDETNDKSIKTSRVNIIEVSVPKSIVPALIGRSGSNIKQIEKKSGALIHFKKFSDKEYDVCIIRGRSDATQLAETMIHEFINHQPVIVEDSMTVPNWACGRIIGTGGESINDISHRSGARVKIEAPQLGGNIAQRQITLRGTKEQIEVAKGLVENCVAQEKCRREIEQSKRSPRHGSSSTGATGITAVAGSSGAAGATEMTRPLSPGSEHGEDMPGDASRTRVKYKRPEAGGSPIEVYVSAVSSPARFWVQFVGPQVAQLDQLVEHMTEYYGNKDNRTQHQLNQVCVGQVVAAVFRHDSRWYRARVHDLRPNEFDATQQVADVFFVDYGDSEYVATHELCELRADLLRLRFQAMECFLAGVKPAGNEIEATPSASGQRWDRWHPQAVERFEELTQVARWKPLVSRTCTYKKTATKDGEREKEIPGIKLFDVTDEGEVDIGGVLIEEGWATAAPTTSPRSSPPRPSAPSTPFGDLGNSKVLMLSGGGARSSSLPKDHRDESVGVAKSKLNEIKDNERLTSKSMSSGLEATDKLQSVSNFDISYPDTSKPKPHLNGSHDDFLNVEKQNVEKEASTETLIPSTPVLSKSTRDEFKANMNRIDSHHNNLEALGRSQQDLHK